jgi:hypothetical protein
MSKPVRGTQSLVGQMGWLWQRPSLTALEIGWRWLWGAPVIAVCWAQAQHILKVLPLDAAGLGSLDAQNPWVAVVQLTDAWNQYRPLVIAVLQWLAPAAALGWVLLSGLGRSLVMKRMEPRLRMRPVEMMALQAAWLVLLGLTFWGWYRGMLWAAATHITPSGEPELVGYAAWAIFLGLGFFVIWALVSWALSIAPLLMLLEGCSVVSALGRSLRLGKAFTGKLVEINLVMGIVNLALVVLAMVLSAAPLPFSDQLGPDAMHCIYTIATVFYMMASDYFQVVRLKSFVELWDGYRGQQVRAEPV